MPNEITIQDIKDATEQLLRNKIPMPTNKDLLRAHAEYLGIPILEQDE